MLVLFTLLFAVFGLQVLAQAATLTLAPFGLLPCPSDNFPTPISLALGNFTSSTVQTLPPATTLHLAFSVPVADGRFDLPQPSFYVVAGSNLDILLPNGLVLAPGSTAVFRNILLELGTVPERGRVTVTVTSTPPDALALSPTRTATVALASRSTCQRPPGFESMVTADDLLAQCPSAEEIRVFNSALTFAYNADPTAGVLVCRAADGSADLSLLQERTYQALRLMQQIPFQSRLPWTPKSLYDWFTGAVKGLRFRSDIPQNFCCIPDKVLNVSTQTIDLFSVNRTDWVGAFMAELVRQARLAEGFTGPCGETSDRVLSDVGPWAIRYYLEEWMTFRTGSFFIPRLNFSPNRYLESFWSDALEILQRRFCQPTLAGFAVSPDTIDFGSRPIGSQSPFRDVSLTGTWQTATVAGLELTGGLPGDFILENPCVGAEIPLTCVAHVAFKPTGAGFRSAQLQISFRDADPLVVSLIGVGAEPQPCDYAVSKLSQVAPQDGLTSTIEVSAADGCPWTAVSNAPWINLDFGQNGSGSGTVVFSVRPNNGATRAGTLRVAGYTIGVSQGTGTGTGPRFIGTGVTNGASFQSGISPGAIATLFGSELTRNLDGVIKADALPLPHQLAGTSVSVGGIDAPIFAVANVNGQEQINFQVPYELAPGSLVNITVNNSGLLSAPVPLVVKEALPGIFTTDGTAGAILHGSDLSLVTPSNPAHRNETVIIYATGLGAVTSPPATGDAAPGAPLSDSITPPGVTVGGKNARVLFSGLAPDFVGLFQVNIQVPNETATGIVPVVITSGGAASPPATIALE